MEDLENSLVLAWNGSSWNQYIYGDFVAGQFNSGVSYTNYLGNVETSGGPEFNSATGGNSETSGPVNMSVVDSGYDAVLNTNGCTSPITLDYSQYHIISTYVSAYAGTSTADLLPDYSRQPLLDEMNLFPEWFLTQLLGVDLQPSDHDLLNETMAILVDSALEQPQVLVHRDFHSRNLMLLADEEIGVIDFQDAVTGPLAYDLVSLLRDCYVRWPVDYISQRALNYYRSAEAAGIAPQASKAQILRWFDLMGLQRHIKVLGIFSRLCLRDGKHNYLNDLPLVIRYTLEQLAPYPELGRFKDWFELRVLPQLPQQDWYHPWETAGDE